MPGVPVTDTVKRVRDGIVVETPPRDELVAVQTPQAFVASVLRAAAAGEGSDCASLVEAAGGRIKVVPGDERLLKVTTPDDLRAGRGSGSRGAGVASRCGRDPDRDRLRRASRSTDGVPLVLGGVELDHPRGLAGHSDGDVIAHALIDAFSAPPGSATSAGSSRPARSASAGSRRSPCSRGVRGRCATAGWTLVNADCVLVGEEPRIAPHRDGDAAAPRGGDRRG